MTSVAHPRMKEKHNLKLFVFFHDRCASKCDSPSESAL